jgi:hypothetical protein
MDALWVVLITGAVMVVYMIILVRASIRGKQWAIETLKAMSCLVEGPGAASAWLREEHREPEPGQEPDQESEIESAIEPESELVA